MLKYIFVHQHRLLDRFYIILFKYSIHGVVKLVNTVPFEVHLQFFVLEIVPIVHRLLSWSAAIWWCSQNINHILELGSHAWNTRTQSDGWKLQHSYHISNAKSLENFWFSGAAMATSDEHQRLMERTDHVDSYPTINKVKDEGEKKIKPQTHIQKRGSHSSNPLKLNCKQYFSNGTTWEPWSNSGFSMNMGKNETKNGMWDSSLSHFSP